MGSSVSANSGGVLARIRAALPKGQTLPERDWRRRHHAMVAILFADAVGLTIFSFAEGYGALHSLAHIGVLVPLGVLALVVERNRRVAAALVALGMITASAALVHVWHGVIEAHFLFFVTIVVLALYEDWVPFLVAAAYVFLHHGVAGAIDPSAIYNHADAVEHPWKWAAIHSVFIAAAGIAAVANWRVNEDVRAASAHQALHDELTGLPNRRALLADLERGIREATPDRPLVLALFDLDGFKSYNDSFGHPAGDELLVRVAHRLRGAVGDGAEAYRMGGDEFCAVAWPGHADPAAVTSGADEALREHGVGFTVSASWGSVTVPAEASTIEDVLRTADTRMYARKGPHGRTTAGGQSVDVLLKILAERSPQLSVHLDQVAALAHAVADHVGLPEDKLVPLLQAASLHDAGKVAIPDTILEKPAALDDGERSYVERRPVVGERILAVAPALRRAAVLVRSSHERFDGKGYPDGLSGDEIPLESRIIFVCDAYAAMVSDRPYGDAMPRADALAELRRCAGTQFDPEVVAAFCEIIDEFTRRVLAADASPRPNGR